MIQYILECIAFQLAFLVIYDFFLKKETFFQWNRVYLIGTYIMSLILPWVKIEALKTTVPENYYVYPEFLLSTDTAIVAIATENTMMISLTWQEGVLYGGMLMAAVYFGYKLFQLHSLSRNGTVEKFPNFTRVVISNSELAFSFFRSIFLGDKILNREHSSIIKHELVHIEQRHTLDLLFFELMRIVGWFNPLVYVYQNRIAELHEFIADAEVPKTERKAHYDLLLSQIFKTQNISFVNHFFKSSLTRLPLLDRILTVLGFGGQVKKRIVMLQKSKSKKIFQLKYLLLVPMLVGMLVYTSCEKEAKLTDDTEMSSEDQDLIASIQNKIDNAGSDAFTIFSSGLLQRYQSEDEILNKEEYFEYELAFGKMIKEINKNYLKDNPEAKKIDLEIKTPSNQLYLAYVAKRKALQLLDASLRASIGHFNQDVALMETLAEYPSNYSLLRVANSKKLTTSELQGFNKKMAEIEEAGEPHTNLIISDGIYSFYIFNKVVSDKFEVQMSVEKLSNDEGNVPFSVVEEVPIFPGCENATDKRACFNEKIQKHISKNFNYPEAAQEAGIQGRVSVMFIIQEDGSIGQLRMRGPDKLLEDEVERIIKRLPTMTPGKQKGAVVAVPFSIPVTFKLQ